MLIFCLWTAFIWKFTNPLHSTLDQHTVHVHRYAHIGCHLHRFSSSSVFPRWGGESGMSQWSGAQSFWQQRKVSQQVTAGWLSAREGVTSHRETTSLICHFRSVSQRKQRREGETDRERESVRALKYNSVWFRLTKPGLDRLKDVGLVDVWQSPPCLCYK